MQNIWRCSPPMLSSSPAGDKPMTRQVSTFAAACQATSGPQDQPASCQSATGFSFNCRCHVLRLAVDGHVLGGQAVRGVSSIPSCDTHSCWSEMLPHVSSSHACHSQPCNKS